jgi:hypothetical protein
MVVTGSTGEQPGGVGCFGLIALLINWVIGIELG